jgi:hypothetical protein
MPMLEAHAADVPVISAKLHKPLLGTNISSRFRQLLVNLPHKLIAGLEIAAISPGRGLQFSFIVPRAAQPGSQMLALMPGKEAERAELQCVSSRHLRAAFSMSPEATAQSWVLPTPSASDKLSSLPVVRITHYACCRQHPAIPACAKVGVRSKHQRPPDDVLSPEAIGSLHQLVEQRMSSAEPSTPHPMSRPPRHLASAYWRWLVGEVDVAMRELRLSHRNDHVYEFGVFAGGSMVYLWKALRHPSYIWAFDSFRGLPEDKVESVPAWRKGAYAADPRSIISATLGSDNVGWVPGFYSASLPRIESEGLPGAKMHTARYVDIDCDLYSSSRDALRFLLRNGLLAAGSLVGYDDWWVLPCGDPTGTTSPLDVGEGRAHAELSAMFDVEFVCVAGSCLSPLAPPRRMLHHERLAWGAVFVVASIGKGRGHTGFVTNATERAVFQRHPNCIKSESKDGRYHVKRAGFA